MTAHRFAVRDTPNRPFSPREERGNAR